MKNEGPWRDADGFLYPGFDWRENMDNVVMVDGKPHKACNCPKLGTFCQKGLKRALDTTQFRQCLVPADSMHVAVQACRSGDRAILQRPEGLELLKAAIAELESDPCRLTDEEVISLYCQGTSRQKFGDFAHNPFPSNDTIIHIYRTFEIARLKP